MKELMEPEQMLDILSNARALFRQSLTPEERETLAARDTAEGVMRAESVEDFEYQVVLDAVNGLERELREALESRHKKVYEDCLDAYYVMEELSHQPEHAHLIPKVAELRRLHEQDFGKPIPPRH